MNYKCSTKKRGSLYLKRCQHSVCYYPSWIIRFHIFSFSWQELLAMHPPPSPARICPFSDAEGLGGGCIKLNEAAAWERMPADLWKFHLGSPSGTWFSRWQI